MSTPFQRPGWPAGLCALALGAAAALTALPASTQTAPAQPTRPPSFTPDPAPPQAAERTSVVTMPVWVRQPMIEYPEHALYEGSTDGRATIRCRVQADGRLSDCETLQETPAGMGFGDAAIAGAARARVSVRPEDAGAAPRSVVFTIRFARPEEPPLRTLLVDPPWARLPRPVFPRRTTGIDHAAVRLECTVTRDTGRLRNCVVKQEDPAGRGFGEAAIRAVRDASISALGLYDAAPQAQAIVTVTFDR